MYVCVCNSITDRQIREAAHEGMRTLDDLRRELRVATCCGRCADYAQTLLDQETGYRETHWTPQPTLALA